jgi:hypothetical protein
MKKFYFLHLLKTFLLILTVLLCIATQAQNGFLVVKKKNKAIMFYGKGSRLTFQAHNGDWLSGTIDKIDKDSFTFSQQIIRYYTIGIDTLDFKGLRFSLTDIAALPSKKQHFTWLRNGFIFQLGGAGYAGLNVVNDLYRKDPPFARDKLGGLAIAAGTFLTGTLLHMKFDPYIRPGRKYSLHLIEM